MDIYNTTNQDLLDPAEQKYFTEFLDYLTMDTPPPPLLLENKRIEKNNNPSLHHVLSNRGDGIENSMHNNNNLESTIPLVKPIPSVMTTVPSPSCLKKSIVEDQTMKKRAIIDSGTELQSKKTKRELLTADEKRVNHVVSEQKRRNLIRVGFQSLVDSVPSLMGNNSHSKSTILFKSSEYIASLKEDNQQLMERIHFLEKQILSGNGENNNAFVSSVGGGMNLALHSSNCITSSSTSPPSSHNPSQHYPSIAQYNPIFFKHSK